MSPEGPPARPLYLQGSAVCCRLPSLPPWRGRQGGWRWASSDCVQLTSFRRCATAPGKNIGSRQGCPLTPLHARHRPPAGGRVSWSGGADLPGCFPFHRIASQVDHTCGKSTQKGRNGGLIFLGTSQLRLLFLSGLLACGVTPKSSWHHKVRLRSFDNNYLAGTTRLGA